MFIILIVLCKQFSNLLISQRDMSAGPRLGTLSNARWSGVLEKKKEDLYHGLVCHCLAVLSWRILVNTVACLKQLPERSKNCKSLPTNPCQCSGMVGWLTRLVLSEQLSLFWKNSKLNISSTNSRGTTYASYAKSIGSMTKVDDTKCLKSNFGCIYSFILEHQNHHSSRQFTSHLPVPSARWKKKRHSYMKRRDYANGLVFGDHMKIQEHKVWDFKFPPTTTRQWWRHSRANVHCCCGKQQVAVWPLLDDTLLEFRPVSTGPSPRPAKPAHRPGQRINANFKSRPVPQFKWTQVVLPATNYRYDSVRSDVKKRIAQIRKHWLSLHQNHKYPRTQKPLICICRSICKVKMHP